MYVHPASMVMLLFNACFVTPNVNYARTLLTNVLNVQIQNNFSILKQVHALMNVQMGSSAIQKRGNALIVILLVEHAQVWKSVKAVKMYFI